MILTVICDVLGRENNGTTIAAMNLVRSMREHGHTVRVVCADEFRRGEKDFYVVPTLNLIWPRMESRLQRWTRRSSPPRSTERTQCI